MLERPNRTVSKTVVVSKPPWVQIPPLPPCDPASAGSFFIVWLSIASSASSSVLNELGGR